MFLTLKVLSISSLLALAVSSSVEKRAVTTVQGSLGSTQWWNDYDGGLNNYTFYQGNGSSAAGWPPRLQWLSFNDMWTINQPSMARSCENIYKEPNMSSDELLSLYNGIKNVSQQTLVDKRFIFAIILQESRGCVRAASSVSADGVHNPGLMQDFKGTHTCNDDGKVQTPCPNDQILGMISDGVSGAVSGATALVPGLNNQSSIDGIEYAEAYYRTARYYNSGAIDSSGDLGAGSATHCYATDIANRLTGWIDAASTCTLDSTNSTSS